MNQAPEQPGPDSRRLNIAVGGLIAVVIGIPLAFAIIAFAFYGLRL